MVPGTGQGPQIKRTPSNTKPRGKNQRREGGEGMGKGGRKDKDVWGGKERGGVEGLEEREEIMNRREGYGERGGSKEGR